MTVLIEARGLTKVYGGKGQPPKTALNGVDLSVRGGEFVAIVGPSGSGKSTLLNCLAGLEGPTSGSIRVLGRDLEEVGSAERARIRREDIGVIFQSYNLLPFLSLEENVALPLKMQRRKSSAERAREAMISLGVGDVLGKLPEQTSGGQQQRAAIARVLAQEPSVIFADEPTGALDTENAAEVLDRLRIHATGDKSTVMVTHNVEAAAVTDRVIVIVDGRIRAELTAPTPEVILHHLTARAAPKTDTGAVAAEQ